MDYFKISWKDFKENVRKRNIRAGCNDRKHITTDAAYKNQ